MIAVLVFGAMLATFVLGFILGRVERKGKSQLIQQPEIEFSTTLKADLERLRTKIDRREANRRPRGARGRFLKKPQA